MLRGLFEFVDALPSSVSLRESLNGYVYLLTAHVVSMGLVAGIIGYWDMRLAGMALKWVPVSKVKSGLFPWMTAGVVVNAATGILMVYSQPMRYYPNFWFWLKMGMLVVIAAIGYGDSATAENASSALLLHIAGYTVSTLALFAALIALYNRTGDDSILGLRGLAETQPFLAWSLSQPRSSRWACLRRSESRRWASVGLKSFGLRWPV